MTNNFNDPVLLGRVDLRRAGNGTRMLIGDLDGDGRMDILMMQPDGGIDDRYVPHEVQCLTAFDLEGNLLWQAGQPDPQVRGSGSDIPAQIYDFDGDGYNEALCVMDGVFRVLDGRTGAVKQQYDLPDPDAHDCIVIANLSGTEQAQDIILKDRYRRMWALDKNFDLLWTHQGNPGHFPWPHDFDGDGRDEVMAGYAFLDHDGTQLWECHDLEDHADCLWVGNVDQNSEGYRRIVIGGSVTVMYDHLGREMWRYPDSIESQHVALGRFDPERDEILVAGLDRIRRGRGGIDGLFLLSSQGQELAKEDRQTLGWLTIINTLQNWQGEGRDYILAYRRGGGLYPGLYNAQLEPVVTFPAEGRNVVYGDLLGQGKEDVIVYSDETAHIFASRAVDLAAAVTGQPLPQNKRLSHATLYPGGEYPEA